MSSDHPLLLQPTENRRRFVRARYLGLLAVALLLPMSRALSAQGTGTISGQIIDAKNLRGVDGAQILVQGTNIGAVTDGNGGFRLSTISGSQVTLQVRRIGYKPTTQLVNVGRSDIRISLAEQLNSLSEVVITGTAEPVERRAIGNSITKIDAAAVQNIAPAPDVSSLLNGRAAGVVLSGGSGAIGSGPRIRIRGAASLSLNDQPLIYLDGVRIANDVSTGPRSQFFSSGVISRLNDIDPENIESIEVIKGPAAATLYGTEANNGVIQIITKRGKAGRPVFTANTRMGNNWFQDAENRIPNTYRRMPDGTIASWNPVAVERAAGRELFANGLTQSYNTSLNGGTEAMKYNFSSSYDNDKGIEPTNHLARWSAAGNISISPYKSLDIQANFNTTQQTINVPLEAGGGMWFSAYFGSAPVTEAEKLRRGFFSAPPEAFWSAFKQYQNVKRTTGSLQFNHRLGTWLTQRLVVGNDLTGEDNVNQTERMTAYNRQFFGNPVDQNGNKLTRRQQLSVTSVDYAATAKRQLFGLQTSTSFGAQYFKRQDYVLAARGEGFPAGGLSLVDAAATTFGGEDYFENATLGFYGQHQVNMNDRAYLTVALRVDNNSAFGEDFSWTTYPKVAGTWVVNEEPWFPFSWVNQLKLRAAYGETGQQPAVNSALRTYAATTGGNGASAVTPQALGNPNLRPERGKETEVGFDGTFLQDRLSVEFTAYRRNTEDGILSQEVAPSAGFAGNRFINIGQIRSQGVELAMRYAAVARENINVDLGFNISRNNNQVMDLGDLPLPVDENGDKYIQIGAQRHIKGRPVASWYDFRVISATFDPVTKRATNALCDNGKGGTTPCLNAVGQGVAPRVFLGRPDPGLEGSYNATVTLRKRWRLYGQVDFKGGNVTLNNNDRARCQVLALCMANLEPEKNDPALVAQLQSPGVLRNFAYQNASFTRLRELSVAYLMSPRTASLVGARSGSLTLSGRNVALWTNYPGTDPENFFTLQQFVRLEQAQVPPLAQLLFSVSLTY